MTVSRVLRGGVGVGPDTRDRVLAAVRELNYQRNQSARNLRLGRAEGLVGLVVTNLANPFYSRLAVGIEELIGERGLRLVVANTGEDAQREAIVVEDLASRQVSGMVVVPAGRSHAHLGTLEKAGIQLVLVGRPATGVAADCVLVDDFGGARSATTRLVEQGHQRIGFLGNPPSVYTGVERYRGFRAALAAAGIKPDGRLVRRAQQTVVGAERASAELLAAHAPPSALFCANNQNTMGALRAIARLGFDIAVAGFDDFELADILGIPLIIASYNAEDLGREAARLLLERMERPELGAPRRRLVVPTTVIGYGF